MSPSKYKPHILLVDDEIEVIRGYRDYLARHFQVHLATSVKQALGLLQSLPIQVLVTDLVMPEQDGRVLLSIANREHRRPIKIVMSAFVEQYFNDTFQNQYRVYTILRKPLFDLEGLLKVVEEAVQEYEFRYGPVQSPTHGFLNAEEVLKKMGISRPTLYKYLRSGLPSKQVFGRRFFDWNEIAAWVNQQPNFFPKRHLNWSKTK